MNNLSVTQVVDLAPTKLVAARKLNEVQKYKEMYKLEVHMIGVNHQ